MKKINLVTSLIGSSILVGSTMAITSCGHHQSKRDDNPAKIAALFSSSALVKPVKQALTTKITTKFSKVTINDFDQSMIKYDKTNKVATVALSGTVAISNVGVNYYTLTLTYDFNKKVYSGSAITLNTNGNPNSSAISIFTRNKLVGPVNQALSTKLKTTKFSKVTINTLNQANVKYNPTTQISTLAISGTVAIAEIGQNNYTLMMTYDFNKQTYSSSAIKLSTNDNPYSVAIITKKGATIALKSQITELSTFSNVDISVDAISRGNIATGHISYKVYEKYILGTHYIMKNLKFKTQLKFNKTSKIWTTSDLNSLINPNKALAMSFAKIDYASYHGVIHRLWSSNNAADKDLNYQYSTPAHLNNWTDPNTKGLSPTQIAKIKASNIKAVDSKMVGNSLVVSYRAHAITTSITDKSQRRAYNFTFSKTWDLTDDWGYEDHGSISNISATLTEATKHYIFTLPDKTLTDNTNLVAKPNVDNSWLVVVNGKAIATVSFDPLQTDLKKDWTVNSIK